PAPPTSTLFPYTTLFRSRSKQPTSILASLEKGGVFTSPRNQTIGLSASGLLTRLARFAQPLYVKYDIVSTAAFGDSVRLFRVGCDTSSPAKVAVARKIGAQEGVRALCDMT